MPIVTVPLSTKKIRFALFPLIVRDPAPGPEIVTFLRIAGSAFVSVMVVIELVKLMELKSPRFTFSMPSAKVPPPELAELVTVKTCARLDKEKTRNVAKKKT